MDIKGVLATVLVVVGVAVSVLAWTSPWYTVTVEGSGWGLSGSGHFDMYFDRIISYGPSSTETNDYSDLPRTGSVNTTAGFMTMLAILLGLVGVVLAALASVYRVKGSVASIALILFSLLILLTPLLYYGTLTDAIREDYQEKGDPTPCEGFISEKTQQAFGITITTRCGPADGWNLMFVSFICVMLAGIIVSYTSPVRPTTATAPGQVYSPHQQAYQMQQVQQSGWEGRPGS